LSGAALAGVQAVILNEPSVQQHGLPGPAGNRLLRGIANTAGVDQGTPAVIMLFLSRAKQAGQ